MTSFEALPAFDPLRRADGSAPPGGARRYVLLDAFTDTPLSGNQLAVFLDGRGLDTHAMQALARELNLSESVFALPPAAGGDVAVRIFTPTQELPFAGHPVLGSAALTAHALGVQTVTLETGAGAVELRVDRDGPRLAHACMSQPLPTWQPFEHAERLLDAVGVTRSQLPVEVYCNGPRHVFVGLEDERGVRALRPDLQALAALGELGVSCFAPAAAGRWRTRMFAPGMGVPEDPATGSAAGPLAVHLARHGRIAFGAEAQIVQGDELGRPSLLRARAVGSAQRLERVEVAGAAVIVGAGEMLVDGLSRDAG